MADARTEAMIDGIVDDIVDAIAPGATSTRRPFVYATSARLEAVEVQRAHGTPLQLVAKHLGRHAMTDAARLAKPAELHHAGRELAVYRHVLAGAGLGTPELLGGGVDDDDESGVLVIEKVPGNPLAQIGDFAVWEGVARWLARMHAAFFARPPRLPERVPGARQTLVNYDRETMAAAGARGLERAAAQALGSADLCVSLAARHEYALRALESATPTLVHGDFYPSNIVVADDRIAVVDWELAGIGPAVLDLAALVAGEWSSERRQELLRAYHQEAFSLGRIETFTALVRRVELASLHLALRWVGSTADWEAPDEHRRDWFADAVAALARLDGGSS